MTVLSAEDRTRLETEIRAAERRTSAEFALVVADASDEYPAFPLLWAALGSLLAAGATALVWPYTAASLSFAIQSALFIVLALLLSVRRLRIRVVPRRLKQAHAARLARLQFASIVHERTRAETGILLFVSVAERHVEILPDAGIAARVPQAMWQQIVNDLVPAVRTGRLADGLVSAISACVAVLEKEFPAAAVARNEIADQVTEIRAAEI